MTISKNRKTINQWCFQAIERSALVGRQRTILKTMVKMSRGDSFMFWGRRMSLAKTCDCSLKTVNRCMAALQNSGLVDCIEQGRGGFKNSPNVYAINVTNILHLDAETAVIREAKFHDFRGENAEPEKDIVSNPLGHSVRGVGTLCPYITTVNDIEPHKEAKPNGFDLGFVQNARTQKWSLTDRWVLPDEWLQEAVGRFQCNEKEAQDQAEIFRDAALSDGHEFTSVKASWNRWLYRELPRAAKRHLRVVGGHGND